eukprot:5076630-Pleurochrysis_carterae.AAC.2
MYLSGDKYAELTCYLASTFHAFSRGLSRIRTEHADEQGCWADVQDGEDAWLQTPWLGLSRHLVERARNVGCTAAESRAFVSRSTSLLLCRLARSPTLLRALRLCTTKRSVAQAKAAHEALSENKQQEKQRAHSRTHAGQLPLKGKLFHNDHLDRHISLLHCLLNSVSPTPRVAFAAGASPKARKAMSAEAALDAVVAAGDACRAGRSRRRQLTEVDTASAMSVAQRSAPARGAGETNWPQPPACED